LQRAIRPATLLAMDDRIAEAKAEASVVWEADELENAPE